MAMKTFLTCLMFCLVSFTAITQVPQGFNYQAIARDGSGNPIINTALQVKISLLSNLVPGTVVWEELHSTVQTNAFGLFTLVIGSGVRQSGVSSFADIDWATSSLFLKCQIYYNSSWKDMGSSQLWAVPYAMVAGKTNVTPSKIEIVSEDDLGSEPLFEVKRKDGQTVFAVYNNAVNVYVPNQTIGKPAKGGFAIGGFDEGKGVSQDFFRVTPDSIRAYINDAPVASKGATKGGFAIGGFDDSKSGSINDMYLNITGASAVNTVTQSPQILWYPNKQAFLAGNVHIGSADSVGTNSTALGYKSIAMGNYSQAFGYRSLALGDYSTAIGKQAIAGARSGGVSTASSAFALGNKAKATGEDSYAFGSGAIASGLKSFAFGSIGLDATGNPTTTPTSATQPYSIAFGMGAQATAQAAMGIGVNSVASGIYATALGYNAQANGTKSISIGAHYNYNYFTRIFIKFPFPGHWSYILRNVDQANISDNDYSVAIGNGNRSKNGGLSFGTFNRADSIGAIALGHSNWANRPYSFATGYDSYGQGTYSFAAGYGNRATGENAFALGESVIARAANSFVVGTNNIVAGTEDMTEWVTTDPLFIIGNGGAGSPSNAMVVAKNGNTTITGNLTVTGTINSWVGTGDGLGTHTATQNLKMSGKYISNDGDNEGIWVNTNGDTYIYGTHYATGRSEVLSTTDATGTTGTGGFEIANTLRLDGDEIITNSGTTLLINDDNSSNVQVDGGTLFVDATNNRIGINNVAPAYSLDVAGTMNVTGTGRFSGDVSLLSASPAFYFYDTDLNADDFRFEANNDALSILSQGKVSYLLFTVTSGGAVGMPNVYTSAVGSTNRDLYIDNTGKLGYVSSSLRYKKDIEELNNISWLYDLRPVTYRYKNSDSSVKQIGLIAEDVQRVNPDFVSFNPDGTPETVSYSSLVTPLLKAVQDQKKTIETLLSENEDLRARLEKIETMVSTLTQK